MTAAAAAAVVEAAVVADRSVNERFPLKAHTL